MTDAKPPEAQPKKALIYSYLDIPEGEFFNPDRPSLELACGGNKTMGNVLGFLASKASYVAKKQKLESCKVVTISVERAEILSALRISEKTYICCLNRLKGYEYIDFKRYARGVYDVSFTQINKGIKNPPPQKLRGRPKGTGKCHKVDGIIGTENTSTLPENTSTFTAEYVHDLEMKVEAITEKWKVLQDKVESITTFEKELQLFRKVLQLSLSSERSSQEALAAFSARLDYLESNEITVRESNCVSALAPTPSASSSLHWNTAFLENESPLPENENDTQSQFSTDENAFSTARVDNLEDSGWDDTPTLPRIAIVKGQADVSTNLTSDVPVSASGTRPAQLDSEPHLTPSDAMHIAASGQGSTWPESGEPDRTCTGVAPATQDTLFSVTAVTHSPDVPSPLGASESPPASGKGKRPKKPEVMLLCEPRVVKSRIEAFRGYKLEERGAIIQENIAIKDWCEKHTADDLDYVMTAVEEDPYWKKEENRAHFFAKNLALETPKKLTKRVLCDTPPDPDKPDWMRADGTTDYLKYVMWKAHHPDDYTPSTDYVAAAGNA